ncbi:MAG TPA: 50S ribosomal protein L9 [Ignavibacteria bacterium]|nr:50S ribosomal protein L9 [Ignavibacteria bacterium]
MKVILKKDYELLGDEGQIVDVKNGYARNFLFPKNIAASANVSNLKSFEEIKKQQGRKIKKFTEEAQKLASEISKNKIEIKVTTGEDERIFGSVTSQMIFDALIEKGFQGIEKRKILISEPIKSLGEHEVELKLQHSVSAKIIVSVVNEKSVEKVEEIVSES